MRTLVNLGQRDGARMNRILEVLQRSKGEVSSDFLADCGKVTKLRVAALSYSIVSKPICSLSEEAFLHT